MLDPGLCRPCVCPAPHSLAYCNIIKKTNLKRFLLPVWALRTPRGCGNLCSFCRLCLSLFLTVNTSDAIEGLLPALGYEDSCCSCLFMLSCSASQPDGPRTWACEWQGQQPAFLVCLMVVARRLRAFYFCPLVTASPTNGPFRLILICLIVCMHYSHGLTSPDCFALLCTQLRLPSGVAGAIKIVPLFCRKPCRLCGTVVVCAPIIP